MWDRGITQPASTLCVSFRGFRREQPATPPNTRRRRHGRIYSRRPGPWRALAAEPPSRSRKNPGDFGILIHVGWSRPAALACNLASGSTVVLGGLPAYGLAGHADVTVLLPFAAGNFVCTAFAGLVPELTTVPAPYEKAFPTAGFGFGLILPLITAALAH